MNFEKLNGDIWWIEHDKGCPPCSYIRRNHKQDYYLDASATQFSATELREMADKLDELNRDKKRGK